MMYLALGVDCQGANITRLSLIGLLAAVLISPAAAATARPAVHLATLDPVKVVGTGFAAGERVTVRVFPFGSASFSKVVTVKSTGRFVALFTARAIDECKGYRITAVGDEGHRASTRHIPPPCGVETIP